MEGLIILSFITLVVGVGYKCLSDAWQKKTGRPVVEWLPAEEEETDDGMATRFGCRNRFGSSSNDFIDHIHGGVDPTGSGGRGRFGGE